MSEIEPGAARAAEQGKEKEPMGHGELAARYVQRARKLSERDPEDREGAAVLLRSANVLALLDLASAIRETRPR
jgi:hypothetical protein